MSERSAPLADALIGLIPIALVIGLWQALSGPVVDPYFISSPARIARPHRGDEVAHQDAGPDVGRDLAGRVCKLGGVQVLERDAAEDLRTDHRAC